MNKSELVAAIGAGADLSKQQAEKALDALVATVMSEVKAGNKVSLIGFGAFNPTARGARTGRNPQTGAPVKIAASRGVRFAAGAGFKSVLNSRGGTTKVTAKKTVAKKAVAKKAVAKKTVAKKTVAKKAVARKSMAKKAPARKSMAKKAPARKSTAKKAPVKKVTAARKATKKSTAKRR
ncbi:MAG: HU family DNA-binding protein [Acidimicrobiales bacterium]